MKIRIFDPTLALKAEIDSFETLILTRKFLGIETAELVIPTDASNASELKLHYILHAGDTKVFEILQRTITQEDRSMLRVAAFGFGKTLAKRITVPPEGLSHDSATGSADAVVKAYIDHHLIAPVDSDRAIACLANRANQAGTTITDKSRYKNLLDEVVRVLTAAGRGFFFKMEGGKIHFDTYPGQDLTAGNTQGNPPAIFSAEYDNILDQTIIESMADAQTNVYVAGQGEGAVRTIVEAGSATGHLRFEAFQDARDTDDTSELAYRGLAAQRLGLNTFEARCDPNSNLVYEADFDLGDTVTVKAPGLGLSVDRRITEVRETYQAGQPMQLELTFGDRVPTIQSTLRVQKNLIDSVSTQ